MTTKWYEGHLPDDLAHRLETHGSLLAEPVPGLTEWPAEERRSPIFKGVYGERAKAEEAHERYVAECREKIAEGWTLENGRLISGKTFEHDGQTYHTGVWPISQRAIKELGL